MTSTITGATAAALSALGYDGLSTTIGVALVALLALLLLDRELAPRLGSRPADVMAKVLDVAIVPLLLAFLIVVAARLSELVR